MMKRRLERPVEDRKMSMEAAKESNVIKIFFDPAHYTVMENVGEFPVSVTREGDLSRTIAVDFDTEDGTANAGSDFIGVCETLIFHSGEAHKQVLRMQILLKVHARYLNTSMRESIFTCLPL